MSPIPKMHNFLPTKISLFYIWYTFCMNHNFCSNCVQISNFQMAVKPKPMYGIAPYFNLKTDPFSAQFVFYTKKLKKIIKNELCQK